MVKMVSDNPAASYQKKMTTTVDNIDKNTSDINTATKALHNTIEALVETVSKIREEGYKNTSTSTNTNTKTDDSKPTSDKPKSSSTWRSDKDPETEEWKRKKAHIDAEHAAWRYARDQERAYQQDLDRSRRLAKEAEAELKKDEADPAYKYGPMGEMWQGAMNIRKAQSGTTAKVLTAALTGGFGNLLGLDKVVQWGGSKLLSGIGNKIGAPFKERTKKREQEKADQATIDKAVHDAQLNKRIEDTLAAQGFTKPEKESKGTKSSGATKGAADKTAFSGIETRLDTIIETLKGMSKTEKPKEEKKEKEDDDFLMSIFGKIGSFITGNLSTIIMAGLATYAVHKLKGYWEGFTSGLLKIGQGALDIIKTNWSTLKGIGSSIWNKAADFGTKALNKVGDVARRIGTKVGQVFDKVSPKITQVLSRIKDIAGKALNAVKNVGSKAVNAIKAGLSKLSNSSIGKLIGKVGKGVGGVAAKGAKVFSKVLGPVMSLYETGSVMKDFATKGTTQTVDEYKKNWKWYDYLNPSKMAAVGGDWVGDKIGNFISTGSFSGLTPEEQMERARAAVKANRAQSANLQTNNQPTDANGLVLNGTQQEELNKIISKYGGSYGDYIVEGENDDPLVQSKYKYRPAKLGINSSTTTHNLITGESTTETTSISTIDRPSEETMTHRNYTTNAEAQRKQLEQKITNTSHNTSSNVYQTNITQYNETPIYATGDAARTLAM